jgi:hypothetical protein
MVQIVGDVDLMASNCKGTGTGIGTNNCSSSDKNICYNWNEASIYKGSYNRDTQQYGNVLELDGAAAYKVPGKYIRSTLGLYKFDEPKHTNLCKKVSDISAIEERCIKLDDNPSPDFCLYFNENFDPTIKASTEYNTLQYNKIKKQNDYLQNIQTEISSKDSMLDIYSTTNEKSVATIKILKIFFIFLIIFFITLMFHAQGVLGNMYLGLIFGTLTISYIYYLVWTFKSDNIPAFAEHDANIIKNAFELNINEEGDKADDSCNSANSVENDCVCPDDIVVVEEEEEDENSPVCREIITNAGRFYHDGSSPKQRLFPTVTKGDSKNLEYIQWDKNNNNINETKKYANPNYNLPDYTAVVENDTFEEDKYWTVDL